MGPGQGGCSVAPALRRPSAGLHDAAGRGRAALLSPLALQPVLPHSNVSSCFAAPEAALMAAMKAGVSSACRAVQLEAGEGC